MKNIVYILFFTSTILLTTSCGKPIANFIYDDTQNRNAPTRVVFENQSEKADTYYWDFGDGTTSNETSPEHLYLNSGHYTVRLVAKKGKREKMLERRVFVKPPHACLVRLETTLGDMLIELSNATPKHRDNFLQLIEDGFYDSLLFHRVIDGFMIQGGDPDSRHAKEGSPLGMGGPKHLVAAEFVDSLIHIKGALAAARMGDQVNPEKNSSGSQFYIVQGRPLTEAGLEATASQNGFRYTKAQKDAYLKNGGTPQLDRNYTVFGRVVEGLDVIDKIAKVKTDGDNRPKQDIYMKLFIIK